MANWLIERTVDLQRSASVELYPEALMVCGDHQAHTLRIRVMDGGKPADLTGGSVEGYFVRDDEASVRVGGELNGNTATVTMAQACYAIMGKLTAVVRLSLGGRTITLCALTFAVRDLVTDAIVDPGEVIPSIAELLSKIEAMEAGTAAAVEGAEAANTAAAGANTAKTAANSAASRANTAAASAEGAASDAILAAGDADDAADAANLAAAGANAAAGRVDAAIQTANTAAAGADTARDAANTAAGSANTAASGANAAKTAANTAAGNANTAASGANTAKTAANTAAGNANTAAAGANQAAAKIDNMTAEATPVEPGGAPTVAVGEKDGHKHLTLGIPRGAKGDKGDKGDGYTIKGQAYATVAALQAAVPSPAVGDQYNVGAAAPYNVYRWTGSAWEDQGTIQGQSGQDGVSPTANVVKTGRTATITITDADGTTTATVTDGLDGVDGADAPPTVHVGSTAPTGGESVWVDPDAPEAGTTGADIPVGPEDTRTVAAAIAQLDGHTGGDIPVSETDVRTLAEVLAGKLAISQDGATPFAMARFTADAGGVIPLPTALGALYATGADEAAHFGVLPINCGGTGGTTPAGAREALQLQNGALMIVKWGSFSATVGANENLTQQVQFDTAFPNYALAVMVTAFTGNPRDISASASTLTSSGFTAFLGNRLAAERAASCYWLAIGR